ncbi:MAG: hypothetical protein J0I63_00405 [Thiobacillus sp.]|nr:hypothetical protein [Thiobacillus sp.]
MERAYVWDRFVRLHHWSLATLVLANHFILDGPAHRWAGYAARPRVCVPISPDPAWPRAATTRSAPQ